MPWRIGTIGFSYSDWQNNFYPAGTRPGDYLSAYARAFDTVELDTTFHAIPPLERVQKWSDNVPDTFQFCVKTPKQITHDAPLSFGLPLMRQFLSVLRPMKRAGKLGPVLIQFPPFFTYSELPSLRAFLSELPTDLRYAVEFRNASWERDETHTLLEKFRCAWVARDEAVDPYPIHPTTDFLFIRLIGIHKQFSVYDRERIDMSDRLAWWVEQAAACNTPLTYAMINDDYSGHAPTTANRLRLAVGMPAVPTRTTPHVPQPSLFGEKLPIPPQQRWRSPC